MKAYEKYMYTNNSWYPEIPLNWKVSKVKYIGNTLSGGTPSTQIEDYWENGDIPWLPSGKLQNCEITTSEKFITEKGLNNSSTKWIKPYTVLIALTGATCANIGYLKFRACANQSVIAIDENTESVNSRFLFYMFLEMRPQILTHQTGGAQAGINDSNVKNFYLLLPPLSEQTQIARFLDNQTRIIDEIIKRKEKQIELLKEKRQSINSELVTKGLNPNARMKESGIEWLGEIPEEWGVSKLKYIILKMIGGGTPSTANDMFWNGSIPWISSKDMKSDYILDSIDKISELALENSSTSLISENNLLVVVRSGILRHTFPVSINSVPVAINQDLKAICVNSNMITVNYLFWFFKGLEQAILTYCMKVGATVESIDIERFISFPVLIPKLEEQYLIVDFIENKKMLINSCIDSVIKVIERLKEYRQSLISEAVTGKIDVRDWKPINKTA
jgi:type I restriction enzyme S subunit